MKDPRDKIRDPNCTRCPLHEHAEHVCLMGSGSVKSDVMLIGEAPGAREDDEHQAFVGPAGKLLDEMLESHAGLQRDDCYVTNVAKCRPEQNRTPEPKEIKECVSTYLTQELDMVDPKFILLLGNSALRGVTGRSGITKHRGTQYEIGNFVAMASFHPAAILRNPRHKPALIADFERFGQLVRGIKTNPETKVRIVNRPPELAWLISVLNQVPEFSYDIETNMLEEYRDDSRITSIAFTWEEGHSTFVPLWHERTPWKDPQKVLDLLAPCLQVPKAKHVAQNGKFDARWLKHFGAPIHQTFDTMLAAHMLDENRSKGLKPLAQMILGADAYELELADGKAASIPLKKLAIYNGKDTDYTLRLKRIFKEQLKSEPRIARVFAKLMMPASNALVDVERRGIMVDWDRWLERNKEVNHKCEVLENYMRRAMPKDKREEFNFNSSPQIADWLFGDLGLPVIEHTKSGAWSSKESVLKRLQKQSDPVKALLKWRGWNKYRTTYIGPWAKWIDNDMRMHPTYKLFGTVTGRLSCTNPNLQQVPRNPFIRAILRSEPGYLFVKADYSQVELRIAAMLAHERKMLRLFSAGEDIHMAKACELTGKIPSQVSKEERKLAKAVNFGFLYGMGEDKFIEYARDNYDLDVSPREAARARASFFRSYPQLKPWHDRQKRLAHRYKRVHSPIGRVRHLPDIDSREKGVVADAERQAINSPVQSFASDLMLLSLIQLHSLSQRKRRPDFYVIGTVHDELLFEVRENKIDIVAPLIRDTMMDMRPVRKLFGTEVTVPIEVEVEVGTHWSEGEEWTK